MKLISMVEFVREQGNLRYEGPDQEREDLGLYKYVNRTNNYANFLSQLLELWMFVPCDSEGNVLEEPKKYSLFLKGITNGETEEHLRACEQYQAAKDRVLFKGFEYLCEMTFRYKGSVIIINGLNTIESLYNLDITLTQTALNQIGL